MVASEIKLERMARMARARAEDAVQMPGGATTSGGSSRGDLAVGSDSADWDIEPAYERGKRKSAQESYKESRKLGERFVRKELKADGLPSPKMYKKPGVTTVPRPFRIRYQGENRREEQSSEKLKDQDQDRDRGRERNGAPRT